MISSVRKRSCPVLPYSADGRFLFLFQRMCSLDVHEGTEDFNFAPVKIEYCRILIEQKNDTHRPDGSLQKLNQNNRCMFENTAAVFLITIS